MKGYTLATKIKEENPEIKQKHHAVRASISLIKGKWGKRLRKIATQPQPLTYDTTNSKPEPVNHSAKILVLDIETAPARGFFWDIWNQNINIDDIQNDWFALTWSAKWLFENKVYSARLTGKEAIEQNDKRIMQGIWEMLNQADIVIAHNGDKFDLPRLNTRFIIHRMNPPLPYQSIDTLKTVKRQFAFLSNKLDFVNRVLSLPRKTETGRKLWNDCYNGNEEALAKMEKYNANDVRILEDTYLRLRPWIKPHPNIGLFILDESNHRCPSCGSDKMIEAGKRYYTTVNAYENLRCDDCGATARKRVSAITIKERRHILSSLPK